jgi:hypothetical protein
MFMLLLVYLILSLLATVTIIAACAVSGRTFRLREGSTDSRSIEVLNPHLLPTSSLSRSAADSQFAATTA